MQSSVFRNGSPIKISASDIVVGDTVLLQAGDKIPADGQLVFGELQVNQASLTGEQVPVRKLCGSKEPYQPKDKTNFYDERLCFRGSVVDDGEAIMEVKSVGKATEYGQLYTELADTETRESPLQGTCPYTLVVAPRAYRSLINASTVHAAMVIRTTPHTHTHKTRAHLLYLLRS